MLRWITLVVFVIVVVGATAFLTLDATVADPTPPVKNPVVPAGPSAKLELSEPATYEVGAMPQLSGGKHTWIIKNVGEVDLELTMGETTCSCTIAKLKGADSGDKPKLTVKPQESTSVDVEWLTKTFNNDYRQGVKLITNDPTQLLVSLTVHGEVHPPVMLYPIETIDLKSVSNEEKQGGKVAIFSIDRPETKILKLASSRPEFISLKSEPLSADDATKLKCKKGYWVIVEIKPGMPIGRFQEEAVVETDHPLKSELSLKITGSMSGPISVIPEPRVRMPSVSSSKGGSRDFTLSVRGGRATKFEVVRHPDKLNVNIVPDDTSTMKGRYKMSVVVPPGTAAGEVEGDIVIKTDHPSTAEIKIPVSVFISNMGTG
jgi:hypothetical protein